MRKPKAAVFSIMKGGPDSAVASVRLARYVANQLDLPLHDGSSIASEGRLDVGIIINGPMLYVMAGKSAPAFAKFALRTPHLIWVQNDYTIYAPASESRSESGFRHDFGQRRNHMHYWTTCEMNVNRTLGSSYVNWNMLTYEPRPLPSSKEVIKPRMAFYYGAYRHSRIEAFDRYFTGDAKIEISTVSKDFVARYDRKKTIGFGAAMSHDMLMSHMRIYGAGLYLEDRRSHHEYHSPANRFYEMLGSGLPMLFQPEATKMLARAGYDITPYVVDDAKDLRKQLGWPMMLRAAGKGQAKLWRRNYRKELDSQVATAWRNTLKEIA